MGLLCLHTAGFNIAVSSDLFVRGIRVYDKILKGAAERGWSIRQLADACLQVVVDQEPLDFSVTEATEPILNPATRPGYRRPRRPVGALVLAFSTSRGRVTVSDKRGREVESKLSALFEKAAALAAHTRREHEEIAALHRQWEIDARRRAELQGRIARLNGNVARWEEAKAIREYATAAGDRLKLQGAMVPGSDSARWLAWVYRYADSLDPTADEIIVTP